MFPPAVVVACQVLIALVILNVWLLRAGRTTAYRGGDARSLREEFAVYGLPSWSLWIVGAIKVSLAVALLVAIWVDSLARPAAIGMAVMMLGALAMHVRVGDPPKKALPAASVLVLSSIVALGA